MMFLADAIERASGLRLYAKIKRTSAGRQTRVDPICLAWLPVSDGRCAMSKIDFSQTQVQMPDSIKWTGQDGFPKNSLENAVLAGSLDGEGIYFSLRRVAGTPHYDGVIASGTEPVVIAISGIAPVHVKLVDPRQPGWRRV
jgi:hypothetical protein